MTVVGKKGDATAVALYRQALTYPATYRRIEWLDAAEGALPNPDVTYPTLERPALFACIEKRCSLPIYAPDEAHAKLDRLFGRTG
jgi:hypothetical protein